MLHFNLPRFKTAFYRNKKKRVIIIITIHCAVYYFVAEYFRENDMLMAFVRPAVCQTYVDASDPRLKPRLNSKPSVFNRRLSRMDSVREGWT